MGVSERFPSESIDRNVQLIRMHMGRSAGHAETLTVRHGAFIGLASGLLGAGHMLGMAMDVLYPMIIPSQHGGRGERNGL